MKPVIGAAIHALLNASLNPHKNTVMIPILQMWTMRLRKVKSLAQGHIASKRGLKALGDILPSA